MFGTDCFRVRLLKLNNLFLYLEQKAAVRAKVEKLKGTSEAKENR